MSEPAPLRPDEQVAGGFLVLRLGGQDFEVRVLPMALSRKWLAEAKAVVGRMKGTAEGLESFEDVADFLAAQSEAMMDLLLSYDALGNKALPEREWVDTNATDTECYEGWKRVTAATSPLALEALRIVPDLMPVLIQAFQKAVTAGTAIAIASSRFTSSSQPSTGGPPATSTTTSPTSSSPSTPRKPRSASARRTSPN
jgi:hypothetical protein